jgi:hypothetical protein
MKVWAVVCFRYYSESKVENVYIFSSKELANKFINGAFKDWDYADYEIFEQDLDYPN